MNRARLYVDTSVFGGVFDSEFGDVSSRFFEELKEKNRVLLFSDIAAGELRKAPDKVRTFVSSLDPECLEEVRFTVEMAELRDAYIEAHVLSARSMDDAAHVASATVSRADVIVSWNFRHIVKWDRIRAFNAVNLSLGYPVMTILSPREMVSDEEGF